MSATNIALLEQTRLLALRAPRTIKQGQMADAAGVSHAWISRFLNGVVKEPDTDAVQRLHDYLKDVVS